MKYYLDTSIWRDYYENRSDRFRPLGEWAYRLMQIISQNEEHVVFYSDLVVRELMIDFSESEIKEIFWIINKTNQLKKIIVDDLQIQEAKKLSRERNVPFADAIHAIAARDNCAILVTRDEHFLLLNDICQSHKPEDLI